MCSITIQDSLSVLLFTLLFGTARTNNFYQKQPHIIVFMVDDLGYNDVSFHGSNQILTPNIDALAYNGIILNRHYVFPTGTPSRTAFFTGKYPMRFGLQGNDIQDGEPKGLPLNEKLLPQYLRESGYTTKLIGKWNFGNEPQNNPLYRGFDTYEPYCHGYSHLNKSGYIRNNNAFPYDKYSNIDDCTNEAINIINEVSKKAHSRALYLQMSYHAVHSPIEHQQRSYYGYFLHNIRDPNRRAYANVVSQIDESVSKIVSTLGAKGMLRESIILFLTDNGAASIGKHRNYGSNYPLRGTKYTLYEGGVRGVAFIWSPRFTNSSARVCNNLIHITDWLPTLYAAARGDISKLEHVDGVNQWDMLMNSNQPPARKGLLLNIDDASRTEGIIFERFKLVRGSIEGGYYDGYHGDRGKTVEDQYEPRGNKKIQDYGSIVYNSSVSENLYRILGGPITQPSTIVDLRRDATVNCNDVPFFTHDYFNTCNVTDCLFDIFEDPCERKNVFNQYTTDNKKLNDFLELYACNRTLPKDLQFKDWITDPSRQNHKWKPWLCDITCVIYQCSNASLIGLTYCTLIGTILVLILSNAFF